MAGFKVESRVKFLMRGDGLEALSVPDTHDQVCIAHGPNCYDPPAYAFYATLTGVELPVWDERPDRRKHPGSGRVEDEQPYFSHGIDWAFADGLELFQAATVAGVPLSSSDEAAVRDALARVTFIVTDSDLPISFRRASPPRVPKPRKLTQKRLDGGEDMTV
jgi:hypothetical protein